MNNRNSLLTFVKKEILEHLLIGFCEKFSSGMKIACYNKEGKLILIKEDIDQVNRHWSHICYAFRNKLGNEAICNKADLTKAEEFLSRVNPKAEYYYCSPLNMIDIIIPIKIEDKTLGAIITGQIILEENTKEFCQNLYNEFPEHRKVFEEAYNKETQNTSKGKILSKTRIDEMLAEIQEFANLIGDIGSEFSKNLQLVSNLENEKHIRETFLERAAHSLSLPMESLLIDSCNLVDEINNEDTKRLFNEVQSLGLVVENLLHGSGSTTIQGEPDFVKTDIFKILGKAYEMFMVEASEKGCALNLTLKHRHKRYSIGINTIKSKNKIYKKIILENYLKKQFLQDDNFTIKNLKCEYVVNGAQVSFELKDAIQQAYKSRHENNYTLELIVRYDGKRMIIDKHELSQIYLPNIEMNPRIVELALKNLIHNAVKYSYYTVPSGKKRFVDISCELSGKSDYIIDIANYGVGITDYEIKSNKIWEARYRGVQSQDRNRTGAGLGLAHVKWAICNIHNGDVSCNSRNFGSAYLTNFTIKIPVNQK
jgi:signal transduction histidine kinase